MNYAIILAGGSGTRFWPLSRNSRPKQFLCLTGAKSLIEETLERVRKLVKRNNTYVAANKLHTQRIKECIRGIPSKNIFFEPEGKNTLGPIAYLSKKINDLDPKAVIIVLPSDHFIKEPLKFIKALKKALKLAAQGYIVTLGVHPQRPEAGYGYIKIKPKTFLVDKFIEKPDLKTAKKLIKDKRYYWNAGIFVFKAGVMMRESQKFMSAVCRLLGRIRNNKDLPKIWRKLPAISIDYAIMEKTKRMALVPADFDWRDLGSWQAVEELMKKDRNGNIFKGNSVSLGCKNTFVYGDKRLVATLGLQNMVIVDTKDALLVCAKDKAQDLKKLVEVIKQKKFIKQT